MSDPIGDGGDGGYGLNAAVAGAYASPEGGGPVIDTVEKEANASSGTSDGFHAEMDPGQVASTNAALGALPDSVTGSLKDEVAKLNGDQPQQDGPGFVTNPLGGGNGGAPAHENWDDRLENPTALGADDVVNTGFGGTNESGGEDVWKTGFGGTNVPGGNDVWKNGFGGINTPGAAGNDVWENGFSDDPFSSHSAGPGLPMAQPFDAGNGTPGGGAMPGTQPGTPPDMPPAVANVGDKAADDAEAAWNAASTDPVWQAAPADSAPDTTTPTPVPSTQGSAALPNVSPPPTDTPGWSGESSVGLPPITWADPTNSSTGGATNGGTGASDVGGGATTSSGTTSSGGTGDTGSGVGGATNGGTSSGTPQGGSGSNAPPASWDGGGSIGNPPGGWTQSGAAGGGPQKKPPPARNIVQQVQMQGYVAASLTWVDDSLIGALQSAASSGGPHDRLMASTVVLFNSQLTVAAVGPSPVGSKNAPANMLGWRGPAKQFQNDTGAPAWFFPAVSAWAAANPPPQSAQQPQQDPSSGDAPGGVTYTYAGGGGGGDTGGGDAGSSGGGA